MKTYPIADKQKSDRTFAFEIENAYVGPRTVAGLLREVATVTDIHRRKPFGKSDDVHIEFWYLNRDYVVWEPYGDSSRYWIGPKDPAESPIDISDVENVFKRYRPPFHREVLGDILSLRFIKRFIGRRC